MRAAGRSGGAAMKEAEIVTGSWWQAGPHRLMCGDHEAGAMKALVDTVPLPVSLVYTDPPWGRGNAKYWRTYAAKHGVDYVDPNWPGLMDRLVWAVDALRPDAACIEMGQRWSAEVARRLGTLPVSVHDATYRAGHKHLPNHLIVATQSPAHPLHGAMPILHGAALTRWVFDTVAEPGGVVVDPFVGRGMTVRFADHAGMACYGVELCPHRLLATLTWCEERGYTVERIA